MRLSDVGDVKALEHAMVLQAAAKVEGFAFEGRRDVAQLDLGVYVLFRLCQEIADLAIALDQGIHVVFRDGS